MSISGPKALPDHDEATDYVACAVCSVGLPAGLQSTALPRPVLQSECSFIPNMDP